jgi:hypothetical protein
VCAAFPEGIPQELAFEETPHIEPWHGDDGIHFEPKKGYEDFRRGSPFMTFKRQIPCARPKP